MSRPQVFKTDTKLWHPAEGWKVFPAGETDPGGAWYEKEGGDPVRSATDAGVLKDLIEANDRLDSMGAVLARKDHDLAQIAAERDAAQAKVAGLEQEAIAAKKAQEDAEALAVQYMRERDAARAQLTKTAKPERAAA